MRTNFLKNIPILILLVNFISVGQSEFVPLISDSNLIMLNFTQTNRRDKGDSTLFFNYFFSKKCNNFFLEINQNDRSIILSFLNTRIGGFIKNDTIMEVNKGPVNSIRLSQLVEDKNKEVRGLNPEYYYITTATLKCNKVPVNESIIKITEKDDMISISLPWPAKEEDRDSLYFIPQKKRRKGLIITFAGIGAASVAGGGVLIWSLLSGRDDKDGNLEANFPTHPTVH